MAQPSHRPTFVALGALAVAISVASAVSQAWLSDDCFISFRYARTLLDGHGLVFNAGERVEAMTNFAWTLWLAGGGALGVDLGAWAHVWSVAAMAACVWLLCAHARRGAALVPLAALALAAHPDAMVWATSGLETAPVTMLLVATWYGTMGFVQASLGSDPPRRRVPVELWGGVGGLAALTRPDAALMAPVCVLTLFAFAGTDWREGAKLGVRYCLGWAVLWGPATAWRVHYYGQFYPNTYYAKSADQAWWAQGLRYTALFYERYAAHAIVALLGAGAALRPSTWRGNATAAAWVSAMVFTLLYTGHVMRVGGDFMFARMLVPTVPFVLVAAEITVLRVVASSAPRQRKLLLGAAALALVSPRLLPPPVTLDQSRHGVAAEAEFYAQPGYAEHTDREARVLRKRFEGLQVRVAFLGSQARHIYGSGVPYAIDAEAGLTDPEVARQPLAQRTRPGHEKRASMAYLLEEAEVHLALGQKANQVLGARAAGPAFPLELGGATVWILRWDPDLMSALAERGVALPPVDGGLAEAFARWPSLTEEQRTAVYRQTDRFYVDRLRKEQVGSRSSP